MPLLSEYIKLSRRYTRSINLERDLHDSDALNGYIPTENTRDVLNRFFLAYSTPKSCRAWTLTGPYGSGKSAFAHFLLSLYGNEADPIRAKAQKILRESIGNSILPFKSYKANISDRGVVRAIATAQREPISNTIIRALWKGVQLFWRESRGRNPSWVDDLDDLVKKISKGKLIPAATAYEFVQSVSQATDNGLLIVIDELGKNLEYAAQNHTTDDLFLLQQIAELPSNEDSPKVFIVGLLHQSFLDYAHILPNGQRNEWAKVQGRFESIPFVESPDQTLKLLSQAIIRKNSGPVQDRVYSWAKKWRSAFGEDPYVLRTLGESLPHLFPLHPIAAISLPILCNKFAQNDRSLFTFLTGSQPHSFNNFLKEESWNESQTKSLQLYRVYDYFVDSAGIAMNSRPQMQRWVEIQGRIDEAKHLSVESIVVLKTIGLLNLVSLSGPLRATRRLVVNALLDRADDPKKSEWEKSIDDLIKQNLIIWRKQIDELRIWEGSDFDIEKAISDSASTIQISLAHTLSKSWPLRPQLIQRHSYKSGTLRFFQRLYIDKSEQLFDLSQRPTEFDGVICFWIGAAPEFDELPNFKTSDGKPIVLVVGRQQSVLQSLCKEYLALRSIETKTPQIQNDGVARREIKQRVFILKNSIAESIQRSFDFSSEEILVVIEGVKSKTTGESRFHSELSDLADKVYSKSMILWNELINRKEITAQAAKARSELIEAILTKSSVERLGLEGNGPECTIYESILRSTGIHREENGRWTIGHPKANSSIQEVWVAIQNFFLSAVDQKKPLSALYDHLYAPPYGVRQGPLPIMLAAFLVQHTDDISIFYEGSFIPSLGPENFELIVKAPQKFEFKYFELTGLKAQFFKELESIFSTSKDPSNVQTRTLTLLRVVKPLIRFIRGLPAYTLKTKNISKEAMEVRKVLLEAIEPDHLLFDLLPRACGIDPIQFKDGGDIERAKLLKKKVVAVLKELQSAYDDLLNSNKKLIYGAFSVRSQAENIREDLRVRASYLQGQCLEMRLRSFLYAATNEDATEKEWLEGLVMVIADKPAESWLDDDQLGFEMNLSDMARRFMNLEALQKEFAQAPSAAFDARRITITQPNGQEIHQLIWIDKEKQETIDHWVDNILQSETIRGNDSLKQVLVAALMEKVFSQEKIKREKMSSGKNGKKYA